MDADATIRSIIPALGWSAVFKMADGTPYQEPLICFALIDDHDGPQVVGMMSFDTYTDLVTENGDAFICYHHGDTPHPATELSPVPPMA